MAQLLRCGVKAGATVGYDPQEGDANGLPPGSEGEGAWFICASDRLSVDLRPKEVRQIWNLQVVLPAHSTADRAWTLAWGATAPPSGTRLLLVPADAAGNPDHGPRLSLDQSGSLPLTNSGDAATSFNFLVVWDTGIVQPVSLKQGWNLIGCALEPDQDAINTLLQNPAVSTALIWTPGWGYSVPEALDSASGCLVYAESDAEVQLTGVGAIPGTGPLTNGWNLVSERVRAANAASKSATVQTPAPTETQSTALSSDTAGWIYVEPAGATNGAQ